MNNNIKQYFDKSRFLTIKNKTYADACLELFKFPNENDLVENDVTSKIITENIKIQRRLLLLSKKELLPELKKLFI